MIYKLSKSTIEHLGNQEPGSPWPDWANRANWPDWANSDIAKDTLFVLDDRYGSQHFSGRVYLRFLDVGVYHRFFKGNLKYQFTFSVDDLIEVEESIIREYLNSTVF